SQSLDVRGVIAASIVPGIVVLLLAVWAVSDGRKREGTVGRGTDSVDASPPVRSRALSPALPAICAFYLLRMPETLILLRTQQLGVSVTSVLLLWAALHVVRSSFSFVGGALADRFGPARVMWLGWVSYAAIAYGFARADGPTTALVLFLVLGVVAGLTESPERAIVSKLAGGKQGTGFGVYHAATGIAALAGGLSLGALYQASSATLAFTVSAVGGIALAGLWLAGASGRGSLPAR
ncbi:MAG: MFS transporter, partial [Gemmatimonadales bacterium]